MIFVMWGSKADDLEIPLEELRSEMRIPKKSVKYIKTGHPQWVEGFYGGGASRVKSEVKFNTFKEINKLLKKKPISWLNSKPARKKR